MRKSDDMELQGSLYRIEAEQGDTFTLSLNADHFIYKAHFPGKPVTPGVVIVKTAVELVERKLGRKLSVRTVKNVKFTSVISPVENPKVNFRIIKISEEENLISAQIEVFAEDKVFAKVSVILA